MFIEIPDHIVHNKLIFAFKVIETKNKHIWMVFPIFVKKMVVIIFLKFFLRKYEYLFHKI